MSEFDFEELDRAVSSALDETLSDANRPSDNSRQNDTLPDASRLASTPAARRASGGRFMDMVHPSSTIRGPRIATPVSRPVTPPPLASSDQPVEAQKINEPQIQNETDVVEEVEKTSPFIPDAVVEKRPLGAPVNPPAIQQLLEEGDEVQLLEAGDEQPQDAVTSPATNNSDINSVYVADKINTKTNRSNSLGKLKVVLWIVALVVLGACAGVAVYTLVLPNL